MKKRVFFNLKSFLKFGIGHLFLSKIDFSKKVSKKSFERFKWILGYYVDPGIFPDIWIIKKYQDYI